MPRHPDTPVPVHYLRPNDTVWTPPAVCFLDTETRTVSRPGRDVETLRLWCGHLFDRKTPRAARPRDVWGDGDTADQLAGWLTDQTRNRETVWAWAHNLSFDLAAARLPVQLVAHGWTVKDAAIGGKSPWLRMGLGKRVLTLVDSASWLPHPLAELGKAVGISKPALPEQADGRDLWLARCRADVAILEAAMCGLLDWWDTDQLGRFTISGPACGWNAYRHKQPTREQTYRADTTDGPVTRTRKRALDPIVVNPDPELVAADRLTVHGGRRGVWRIGEHRSGPYVELDFVSAYPTIAANLPLPAERVRTFTDLPLDHSAVHSDRWGISARVLIETDTPRWPVRHNSSTWYPVGSFWADLAGPDIAEAHRLGCLRAIGPGQLHRLGGNMQPWARWVLAVQTGQLDTAPRVAELAAKAWGRSVLGKWAARGYERVRLGPAPGTGWSYEDGRDHTAGTEGCMVDLAGQRFWVAATLTPDNAYPAVLAWVEAHVRTRLNRAVEALGPGAVLQCDTDGLLVREHWTGWRPGAADGDPQHPGRAAARLATALRHIAPLTDPLVLRIKRRHEHVHVLGPQHLTLSGRRQWAGLPGMAEEVAPDTYEAKLWPGYSWQLEHGDPDGYTRPIRRQVMTGPWPTGWLLAYGVVVPIEAVARPDGSTRLLGWNSSSYWRRGRTPADAQHPALAPLL